MAVWPVEQPMDWLAWVNEPQTQTEIDALRQSIHKGRPFGDSQWQEATAQSLGLHSSLRKPGRPKKATVD
jgi:putative transposase